MKTSEELSNFLSFCRCILSQYKLEENNLQEYDKETQDLLHEIELGCYRTRPKYATALSHVRQKRRKSKDFLEINKELVEYIATSEFIKVQRQLEQILGGCRKQEKYVESTRYYNSKVRNDLTINKEEK